MKAKTASRTAQYMALFRAIENASKRDRLFTDPYATLFLDKMLQFATQVSRLPLIGNIIIHLIERKGPGAFSSGIARTRYIDDQLEKTIRRGGIQQVIILGAGFDTRALRLDVLKSIRVIEIDHPNTAALKIKKLEEQLGTLPDHITFLQIDFNNQNLQELAQTNKIDLTLPTVVVWEGVTNYISEEAIDKTFNFLSGLAKNSSVIFTYIDRLVLENPSSFYGIDRILKTLRASEEQWTFGIHPKKLNEFLNSFQYELRDNKNAVEYRSIYMPDRKKILKGYEFYNVALAVKK